MRVCMHPPHTFPATHQLRCLPAVVVLSSVLHSLLGAHTAALPTPLLAQYETLASPDQERMAGQLSALHT